jgi:hypothetical protein
VSEETVKKGETFLRIPTKSVRHASRELETSTMTVWRALRKRLEMKPYRLRLVHFLQSFWYKVYLLTLPRIMKHCVSDRLFQNKCISREGPAFVVIVQ